MSHTSSPPTPRTHVPIITTHPAPSPPPRPALPALPRLRGCRERAALLVRHKAGSSRLNEGLPLNAKILQTTLGVTSEGFQASSYHQQTPDARTDSQTHARVHIPNPSPPCTRQDALSNAIFGGQLLPPNTRGIEDAYRAQDKARKRREKGGQPSRFKHLDPMGEAGLAGDRVRWRGREGGERRGSSCTAVF